jgi:hypothetical protein
MTCRHLSPALRQRREPPSTGVEGIDFHSFPLRSRQMLRSWTFSSMTVWKSSFYSQTGEGHFAVELPVDLDSGSGVYADSRRVSCRSIFRWGNLRVPEHCREKIPTSISA